MRVRSASSRASSAVDSRPASALPPPAPSAGAIEDPGKTLHVRFSPGGPALGVHAGGERAAPRSPEARGGSWGEEELQVDGYDLEAARLRAHARWASALLLEHAPRLARRRRAAAAPWGLVQARVQDVHLSLCSGRGGPGVRGEAQRLFAELLRGGWMCASRPVARAQGPPRAGRMGASSRENTLNTPAGWSVWRLHLFLALLSAAL